MKQTLSIGARLIDDLRQEKKKLEEMRDDAAVLEDDGPYYALVFGPNNMPLSLSVPEDKVTSCTVTTDISCANMFNLPTARLLAMQIKDRDGTEARPMHYTALIAFRLAAVNDAIDRAQNIVAAL